jgi:ABC-type glycerol-3-phosphate transport system substrate-binding protein
LSEPDNSLQRFSHSGAAIGRVDNVMRGTEILENVMFQLVKDFFSEDRLEAIFGQNSGITSGGVRHNFAAEALRFFTSFADMSSSVSPSVWNEFLVSKNSEGKDFQMFLDGKVSMVFGHTGDVKMILETIEKSTLANILSSAHVRVAPLPQFGTSDIPAQKRVVARVIALAVPHSSKEPSLAWQFLKFALRPDSLRGFYQVSKIPSPKSDLLLEQEGDALFGAFASQTPFARPLLFPLDRLYFQKNLQEVASEVIAHTLSPEEALTRLEKKFTQKLKRESELKKKIKKL